VGATAFSFSVYSCPHAGHSAVNDHMATATKAHDILPLIVHGVAIYVMPINRFGFSTPLALP
jgi:hypothetical protein